MTNDTFQDPSYLGDGVYAGHDGYHIWLHVGSHDMPEDRVALEPAVIECLLRYIHRRGGTWAGVLETTVLDILKDKK